ncbi:hypothetical protein GLYMA_01G133200v4 [Glycine max]|nr:hypothetical protein GYH30_001448 [Glycine max]KRH76128.2 hypothetical protein GLYMA_01G133200v4 [Glycine max]
MILQQQFQKQQAMDEVAKIRKRFGDEQSTLLDQFERLSFETHLNKAMLQRSLSEPGFPRRVSQPRHVNVTPTTIPLLNNQGKQRRCRVSGFNKVLKKLLRPILGRKSSGGERKHAPDPRNPLSWKNFSRSLSGG